jgi:hypothetical protein
MLKDDELSLVSFAHGCRFSRTGAVSGPWLVGTTTKVYSGVGVDIVMESITLVDPDRPILNEC